MEVYTTQPGVQLYTANFLDGTLRAGGKAYREAFRLLPGNPALSRFAQPAGFPSTLLRPGEKYEQLTVHKFSGQ